MNTGFLNWYDNGYLRIAKFDHTLEPISYNFYSYLTRPSLIIQISCNDLDIDVTSSPILYSLEYPKALYLMPHNLCLLAKI